MTANDFNERYAQHMHSLRSRDRQDSTSLSFSLRDSVMPNIQCTIADRAPPYSPSSPNWQLMLSEKLNILQLSTVPINQKYDLSYCCQQRYAHLANFRPLTADNLDIPPYHQLLIFTPFTKVNATSQPLEQDHYLLISNVYQPANP